MRTSPLDLPASRCGGEDLPAVEDSEFTGGLATWLTPPLLPACSVLASLLVACTAPPTPSTAITGEDDSFRGSIRISHALGGEGEGATRYGLRAEIDGGTGELVETLAGGQIARLKEVDLAGPGDLDLKFDHNFVGFGFYGVKPLNRFELEGEIGFGRSTLDARASLGALSESAELQGSGLYLGGRAAYQLDWPVLLFYSLRGFRGNAAGDVRTWEAQLGGSWTVNQAIAISAGLQGWNYLREPSGGTPAPSDLDLTLSGPFLRLEFSF